MKHRLFVGIPIPKIFYPAFSQLRENNNVEDVRWVPDNTIHLTISFLGNVEEEYVTELRNEIEETVKSQNIFILNFDTRLFNCTF